MQFIEFLPPAEFTDRYGKTRSIATCSVIGREEFFERISQIQHRLQQCSSGEGWQQLYDRDERLRFLIGRCLTLNGIDQDWVTIDQIEPLLFHRYDSEKGEYLPGWLVELNTPKEPQVKTSGPPLTIEETIALIALVNNQSIAEAVKEARTLPASRLMGAIEAKGEMQDPDYKKKREQKVMKSKVDEFNRLMSIPLDQLQKMSGL